MGSFFSAAVSISAPCLSSARSSLLSVYWKLLLPPRPPTRMSCTGLRKMLTPVIRDSLGRKRPMTSRVASRSLLGLSMMNMKPPPARRPPLKATTLSTAGSALMIPTTFVSFFCMS